jgi:hypothetical protein
MAKHTKTVVDNGPLGFVLFTAWVGALVYFVDKANGFWNVIVAFFQACVWPAYLLYHVLQALKV